MSQKVTLVPSNQTFIVSPHETILEAALSQQIELPHRCQVGVCAMCMCRKIEGEITYKLDPVLTDKEIERGWMFPCQAYAESDLRLTFEE